MKTLDCEGKCGKPFTNPADLIHFQHQGTLMWVVWHRPCYAKAFNASHVLLSKEEKEKFHEGAL